MRIVVCVKQVPDPSAVIYDIDKDTKRLVREGVPLALDPGDEVSLEQALRLSEATPDSTITVVSMGPEKATEAIRRALAMGAHEGVLVSDSQIAGSDALSTAKVLAAAISRGPYDIVYCASESSDGYTGMVPGMLAELLGLPLLSFVRHVEVQDGRITANRVIERGYQVIESSLPAVVSIWTGSDRARLPGLKGVMSAKRKPLEVLNLEELGLDPATVGESGARERVLELTDVEQRAAGIIVPDDGTGAARIADLLQKTGAV